MANACSLPPARWLGLASGGGHAAGDFFLTWFFSLLEAVMRYSLLAWLRDLSFQMHGILRGGRSLGKSARADRRNVYGRRRPMLEACEARVVLSAVSPWQNGLDPYDVNADTYVTPQDALILVNEIHASGEGALPATYSPTAEGVDRYVDVDGDQSLGAADFGVLAASFGTDASPLPLVPSATLIPIPTPTASDPPSNASQSASYVPSTSTAPTPSYSPSSSYSPTPSYSYSPTPSYSYSPTPSYTPTPSPNNAPVAYDGYGATLHDQAYSGAVYGYDMDGDSISFSATTSPANGVVSFSSDGIFTYAPDAGFVGSDSFDFDVTDGLASDTGTYSINVYNTVPAAYDGYGATLHDQTYSGAVYGYDMDGDSISFSATTTPTNGVLSFSSDGTFTYTPVAGFVGSDSFDFEVTDGLASDTGTCSINVYNTDPVAIDDYFTVAPIAPGDSYYLGSALDGDNDVDGDTLTVSLVSGPASAASFVLHSDGTFEYEPSVPWAGYDQFEYEVSDGIATDQATVYIDEIPCGCSTGTCGALSSTSSSSWSSIIVAEATSESETALESEAAPVLQATATSFNYPSDPNSAAMAAWGFQFQWDIDFDSVAVGKLYYQKIHTRVDLYDSSGSVLYWAESNAVDIIQWIAGASSTDTQSTVDSFAPFVKNHVSGDRRVCSVVFTRHATMRLVDSITVDPVGPADPRLYDAATDTQGMVHLHYWDSDGNDSKKSYNGCVWGGQLFEAITSPGANEFYYLSWQDDVTSTVTRPSRFNPIGEITLTESGQLRFRFPDKSTLDPTPTGSVDRTYGPLTKNLW
jgi:hypothetical protein